MNETLGIAGGIVSCIGALFLFLASLGILRMPDVYNRMQAGTKATTLGTILMLGGIAIRRPEWTGKLVLVILFLVLTNPISSHALARAAHFAKIPLAKGSVRDELQEEDTIDGEGEHDD
ncbi:MAG: Na+/H+ antiporter subunit G [Chitinispirillaceae bacterium]|nr:Na+/H+ antiporter subunit G [Chitinispirillaceae bacterium]